MALTILERPIGVILDTCVDATINEDYNGFATVNKTAHGLSDNQWVYIQGNVENYNGFWQIEVINSGEFVLKYSGSYLPYIVDADISYCPQLATHGWSCVHLPITYRISNDLFPVNSADAIRTITGLTNDLGFARVTLSASLATSFEELIFIKISDAPDSDLDGVYQIMDKLSTSSFTLNATYETFTNSGLIGASIQIYHGDVTVNIEVWAGINSSHTWASEKPYELAATLELIPDEDNEVFFSINEILKAYVQTKNNLQLATLPNNIDAWCNFYIKTSQGFDDSNGYTITRTQTAFVSDQSIFEGTAVNAILPFKNIHSGNLSEYLMTNSAAKFLTLFTIPVLFSCGEDQPDCYNDISFLNPYDNTVITVKKEFYLNGVLQTTVNTVLAEQDSGVIRAELSADCTYDRVDVSIISDQDDLDNLFNDGVQQNLGGTDWTEDAGTLTPTVTLAASTGSDRIGFPYSFKSGVSYDLTQIMTRSGGGTGTETINIQLFTSYNGSSFVDATALQSYSFSASESFTITPDADSEYITFQISRAAGTGNYTYILLQTEFDPVVVSETKQFDIDCGCADQEIRITWLNPLGGFDYWVFKAETGHAIDITSTTETTKNIFPEWPKSYGETADTIRKQVSRESSNRLFLTSQYITEDQADALAYIKTSPLVQIINSRTDRRTIIVDSDSFTKYTDNQKLITISFNARYTDNIGSQKV